MAKNFISFTVPKTEPEKKPGCAVTGCGCAPSMFFFFFLFGSFLRLFEKAPTEYDGIAALILAVVVYHYSMKLIRGVMPSFQAETNTKRGDSGGDSDFESEFVLLKTPDLVEFDYIDNSGEITKRRVEVQKIRKKYHFSGHCHLRNAPRTFKFQNIKGKIVRVATGEVLSKNDWLIELRDLVLSENMED